MNTPAQRLQIEAAARAFITLGKSKVQLQICRAVILFSSAANLAALPEMMEYSGQGNVSASFRHLPIHLDLPESSSRVIMVTPKKPDK